MFIDGEFDEELLDNDSAIPHPPPQMEPNQHAKILLIWLVYFILIWQYKNYISDNAIEQLLTFVKAFFTCIATALQPHINIELLMVLATNLPTTLYSARKLLNVNRDSFIRYAVCPKCTKLYKMDSILHNDGQQVYARTCTNIKYPRAKHPKICGSKLVKEVILNGGSKKFYPLKTYCYTSLADSFESLLKRPGFEKDCEAWRKREVPEDIFSDVYDGQVWKSFYNWKGNRPFLELPRSYGLMLNVDWFQPFKHRNDVSVGVIYLVIMNLPRKLRFLRENVILVGVIPAFKKEPESLNYFLEPLVDELQALWVGVKFTSCTSPEETVLIHAALLCCAADIPAARKLCGFLGHNANRGCSHCYKFFPGGFGEPKDYSGFDDRDRWPKRTPDQHRRDAEKVKNCTSKTASKKKASHLGTRYTVLLELPYYSSVTMCVIDPMHNLFLGTAKRVFSKWIENDIIAKRDLNTIQERIELFCSSSDLGRLPGNISSNHGGYTAGQWKNFVLLYSMYVLKGVLPDSHFHYWQSFVLACKYLCQPCISKTDLLIADRKLLDFLKAYERINGRLSIMPNMHLHMHLRESVQNYGSVYGFWLFSFERFNGILGAYQTNGREIEVQIMRKFTTSGILANIRYCLPVEYEDCFLELCHNILSAANTVVDLPNSLNLTMAASGTITGKENIWNNLSAVSIPSSYKVCSLDTDSKVLLKQVYTVLYPKASLKLATLFKKYGSISVCRETYGSRLASRERNFSRIMASWCGSDGIINPGKPRPGVVKYYILHSVKVGHQQLEHMFAITDWLKPAEGDLGYANPLSVWQAKQYEPAGPTIFLPVQRIHSRFISVEECHSNVKYLVVSPVCRRIYL